MASSRLGFSLAPTGRLSIADVLELTKLGEDLGYESVWVPETWGTDLVSVLAVLAHGTERIKLGSGIFNVFSRSAALLAQTAASLQHLSQGRFLLGLGASGPIVIEHWHGVPYRQPLLRTREYVDVIRLALAGERVDYQGRLIQLHGFTLQNPPEQSVPIYVAALGPRNVALTGEVADGWLPIFAARGHMGPLLDKLHAGEAAAGRADDAVTVSAYIPGVIGPRGETLLRQQLAYYIGGMGDFYAGYVRRIGFGDEVERLRQLWESGRRREAVAAVSPQLLSLCTLGSDPREAGDRLAGYRREGIDVPVITFAHGASKEEAVLTLRALAPL